MTKKRRLRQHRQPTPPSTANLTVFPAERASVAEAGVVAQPESTLDRQPYDEGLLDRARHLWRVGDWEALGSIDLAILEGHPQRCRLAVLMASAAHALGQGPQTRLLVRLAENWGTDPRLIAKALIAATHNTLGRAHAAWGKNTQRALDHFMQAIEPGVAHSSRWLAVNDRVRQQLDELHIAEDVDSVLGNALRPALLFTPGSTSLFGDLRHAIQQQEVLLKENTVKQLAHVDKMRKDLGWTVKQEVANAVRQLEAFSNLQRLFGEGEVVPELHGWPVSPDFALLLVEMLNSDTYDAVVEFGSGATTLIIAKVLQRQSEHRHFAGKRPAIQMAFEHLEEYRERTHRLLYRAGLAERVELTHAPLESYRAADGSEYNFYRSGNTLKRLRATLSNTHEPRVLVLVDGPPATTGRHARYPAVPACVNALQGCKLDFLLDDYAREEEKQIASRWMTELREQGFEPLLVEHALEKGACVIST